MEFSSLEELYLVDEKKAAEGVPIPIGINSQGDDIIMIVAEAGSEKHKSVQRKYERALEASRFDEKARTKVMAKIIAEGILMGWEGVLDSDDNEVKYTVENGVDAIVKYERLSIELIDISTNRDHYRPDLIDGTEKNLKPSSDGRLDTESS